MGKSKRKKARRARFEIEERRQRHQETPSLEPASPASRRWELLGLFPFVLVAMVTADYIHRLSDNIIARDALYHLGHARHYATSPLSGSFPWLPYSIIGSHGADIWYGYHLLLAPLTFIRDTTVLIDTAGVLTLAALLVLFYFAMGQSRLALPFLWPFLLLVPFVWRVAQVRPNAVSIGLAVLLLPLLVKGSTRGVFLTCAALSFIHLTFFWLAILMGLVVLAVQLVAWHSLSRLRWQVPVAGLIGLLLGWLLRPHPIGAARVLYAQLIQLLEEKGKGLLSFGRELAPMRLAELQRDYGLFLYLWLGAIAVVLLMLLSRRLRLRTEEHILLWSTLVLSTLFFGMILMLSGRTLDLWAPFSVYFIAAVFTFFVWPGLSRRELEAAWKGRPRALVGPGMRIAAALLLAGLFLAMVPAARASYLRKLGRGVPPDRLRVEAEWLRENAEPGEVVFHVNWGIFPELFYWNTENRYTGGMDPIFQFAYDPALYWKVHNLWSGAATHQTWGSARAGRAPLEDTFQVMVRDFGASYLFLDKSRSPALFQYATADSRFVSRHDSEAFAIFSLK
jgi:hypothetical protein